MRPDSSNLVDYQSLLTVKSFSQVARDSGKCVMGEALITELIVLNKTRCL